MGWPSMRAWTWMATLAVEVSFLLFLLETRVCVYRPASSDARPSDEAAWIRESPSPELGDLFCRLRGPRGSPLTQPGDCGPGGRGLGVKLRRVKSIGTGYSRVRDQFLQTSDGDSSRARSYGMKIKQ